jgi:Arc/MetJ family transcription regulator
MKILIDIDDELITKALKESNLPSHKELIEESLRLLLAQHTELRLRDQIDIFDLVGTALIVDDLDYSRRS